MPINCWFSFTGTNQFHQEKVRVESTKLTNKAQISAMATAT